MPRNWGQLRGEDKTMAKDLIHCITPNRVTAIFVIDGHRFRVCSVSLLRLSLLILRLLDSNFPGNSLGA